MRSFGGCSAQLFFSPRPLTRNRTILPGLWKWLGLPKCSQAIGTQWRSCSTADLSRKAKDAEGPCTSLWWEAGRRWYPKAIRSAWSEESCAGSLRFGGDAFVNDYEEVIDGRRTKIEDRWTDITPNSYTLTEAHDIGNGVMKPYVVSHGARQ